MRPERDELIEIAVTGLAGAFIGAFFGAVDTARKNAVKNRRFALARFMASLCGSGAAGALAAWALDAFGVPPRVAVVGVAMCGYVGGSLLDLAALELKTFVASALPGFSKRLQDKISNRVDRTGRDSGG